VVQVKEVADGRFPACQGGPELLGIGFSQGQHGRAHRGDRCRLTEGIDQQGSGGQELHGVQNRFADAELDLDSLVLAGHHGTITQLGEVLRRIVVTS
jgi:hypothetical protein